MSEGRPGKPRSHRYYLVPNDSIPDWAQSHANRPRRRPRRRPDTPARSFGISGSRETGKGAIDFIGTGGQVVCPPSVGRARTGAGPSGASGKAAPGAHRPLYHSSNCGGASANWRARCGCVIPDVMPRPAPDGSTTRADLSESDLINNRVRPYLAKCDASVSGQGGHDKLFSAARVVVYGFDLGKEAAFGLLKHEFNPRCKPEWTDKELRHKIEDADRIPFDKPRGHLRNAPNGKQGKATVGSNGVHGESDGKTLSPLTPLSPPARPRSGPPRWHRKRSTGSPGGSSEPSSPPAKPTRGAPGSVPPRGRQRGRAEAVATVEGDRHRPERVRGARRPSAKGRKGTSWGRVKSTLATRCRTGPPSA